MKYNPDKHHRRSIRLKGYDYSQPGAYYVTIVVQNRECLFGDVNDGKMKLNTFGQIMEYHWLKIPQHFPFVKLDVYQFMPNHLHGIIIITDHTGAKYAGNDHANGDVRAKHFRHNHAEKLENIAENASPLRPYPRPHGTKPDSLSAIVQNFESVTSRIINRIRKTPGIRLWQRNYWERIIRNKNELNKIRKYIRDNPINWETDDNNPNNMENK
jgi:REP element-mobilizing transposase RayT